MSWIESVEPERAEGRLAELYRGIATPSGQVDAVMTIHGLRPRSLEAHLALYKAALHAEPCGLSGLERELVGSVVSAMNGCDYCLLHHRAALARRLRGRSGGDPAAAAARRVEAGLGAASGGAGGDDRAPGDAGTLSERERALCAYAGALTRDPGAMRPDDLEPLRAAGLDDAGILDLNQVVAYFAYVNRLVLGLGVEVGDEELGLHPPDGGESLRHG
ncbi:MAG TPA: carboxymuconolactone decarboxylase family protein [Gemmatimonadota bacterium]|nr:carboxymuconolactone decarboxylase family protein [Gemmatimonadota bacterium]